MKYEIKCSAATMAKMEDYSVGCTMGLDEAPTSLRPFDTMEEARKELQLYTTNIWELHNGFLVQEFYVEENELVGVGDWMPTGNILEISHLAAE